MSSGANQSGADLCTVDCARCGRLAPSPDSGDSNAINGVRRVLADRLVERAGILDVSDTRWPFSTRAWPG